MLCQRSRRESLWHGPRGRQGSSLQSSVAAGRSRSSQRSTADPPYTQHQTTPIRRYMTHEKSSHRNTIYCEPYFMQHSAFAPPAGQAWRCQTADARRPLRTYNDQVYEVRPQCACCWRCGVTATRCTPSEYPTIMINAETHYTTLCGCMSMIPLPGTPRRPPVGNFHKRLRFLSSHPTYDASDLLTAPSLGIPASHLPHRQPYSTRPKKPAQ